MTTQDDKKARIRKGLNDANKDGRAWRKLVLRTAGAVTSSAAGTEFRHTAPKPDLTADVYLGPVENAIDDLREAAERYAQTAGRMGDPAAAGKSGHIGVKDYWTARAGELTDKVKKACEECAHKTGVEWKWQD